MKTAITTDTAADTIERITFSSSESRRVPHSIEFSGPNCITDADALLNKIYRDQAAEHGEYGCYCKNRVTFITTAGDEYVARYDVSGDGTDSSIRRHFADMIAHEKNYMERNAASPFMLARGAEAYSAARAMLNAIDNNIAIAMAAFLAR
jgi:hypothetical protein